MCSERLMNIIETNKSVFDRFQWLDAMVAFKGEIRPYYILHFYSCDNILDNEATLWLNTRLKDVVRPAFKKEIVRKHAIFSYKQGSDIPYVSLSMRTAIIDAKLDGIIFESARVV